MANCRSNPSAVSSRFGTAITPALLISRSSDGSGNLFVMNSAKARTLASDARSSKAGSKFASGISALMRVIAPFAFSIERAGMIISAPFLANSRAVSYPIPEFAPVIRMRRPCWSGMRSAVNLLLVLIVKSEYSF